MYQVSYLLLCKIIRTRKILKTLKSHKEKMSTLQRMHIQNHVYANKSRRTYVRDICQLLNPEIRTMEMVSNNLMS